MTPADLPPLPCENYVDKDGLWDKKYGPYSAEETQAYAKLAIREVLAELAAVKMHDQATGIQWRAQYVRAEKAEAECERLRKDAERYRWLHTPGQQQDFVCGVAWDSPEEMDAAIDAAMQEKQP